MRTHGRLLVAAAATVAALSLSTSVAVAKTINLKIDDTNDVQVVHVGDLIKVSLPANNTTPYHWKITHQPNKKVAKVVKTSYVQGGKSGLAGAPGTQKYVVKAVGKGKTVIVMRYLEISTGVGGGKDSAMDLPIIVK
jgi:predicted secreted protein